MVAEREGVEGRDRGWTGLKHIMYTYEIFNRVVTIKMDCPSLFPPNCLNPRKHQEATTCASTCSPPCDQHVADLTRGKGSTGMDGKNLHAATVCCGQWLLGFSFNFTSFIFFLLLFGCFIINYRIMIIYICIYNFSTYLKINPFCFITTIWLAYQTKLIIPQYHIQLLIQDSSIIPQTSNYRLSPHSRIRIAVRMDSFKSRVERAPCPCM